MRRVREAAQSSTSTRRCCKRPLNVGFSGGEKKRIEILQMTLLEPRFGVLDETDSGLDIDALRIVADGVNALRDPTGAFLVITHYQRLLDHIKPDIVHVMARGRIVKTRRARAGARARDERLSRLRGRGGVMSQPLLPPSPVRRRKSRSPSNSSA